MYRSVIVPIDGLAPSDSVLPVAVQIARGSEAPLRLVYTCVHAGRSTGLSRRYRAADVRRGAPGADAGYGYARRAHRDPVGGSRV